MNKVPNRLPKHQSSTASIIIAATILAMGLVVSTLIATKSLALPHSVSEASLKSQFIAQMQEQIGSRPYRLHEGTRTLDKVVVDNLQILPNQLVVDFRLHWKQAPFDSVFRLTLDKNKQGDYGAGKELLSLEDEKNPTEVQIVLH